MKKMLFILPLIALTSCTSNKYEDSCKKEASKSINAKAIESVGKSVGEVCSCVGKMAPTMTEKEETRAMSAFLRCMGTK